MRFKNGATLREELHYNRLADGCAYLGWESPSFDAFHTIVHAAALADPSGAISLHYHPGKMEVKPKALDPHLIEYQQTGIELLSYPLCFPSDYEGYEGAKTSDRIYYDEAMAFAKARNLPEVLLLQEDGYVVEGYRTNLFAVIDDVLVTPDSPLAVRGTMQAWIMEQAERLGEPVEMRPIHRDELREASEIFMTNALVECWPVRDYNGKAYPIGPKARWVQSFS